MIFDNRFKLFEYSEFTFRGAENRVHVFYTGVLLYV